jgi:hypothetical protein
MALLMRVGLLLLRGTISIYLHFLDLFGRLLSGCGLQSARIGLRHGLKVGWQCKGRGRIVHGLTVLPSVVHFKRTPYGSRIISNLI